MSVRFQRAQTAAEAEDNDLNLPGRRQATGFATGHSDHCLRRGARRKHRQEHCFRAGGESQADLLRKLPRRVRPGISRVLSNTPARGTAAGIPENQVQAFVERRRTNNIMFHVSHVLSPAMLAALADDFHDLNPKPLTSAAPGELLASGKKIYDEGIAKSDVPPCAVLPRPGGQGRRTVSPSGRPAQRLCLQQTEKLDKERGQRSKKS